MHPHPAFREVHLHDRERELAQATRLAHFERPGDPAPRRSIVAWLTRRCPEVQAPRVREALGQNHS